MAGGWKPGERTPCPACRSIGGVLVREPQQPKSEKPTSSNSTTRIFGAPRGSLVCGGHPGVDSLTVARTSPWNDGFGWLDTVRPPIWYGQSQEGALWPKYRGSWRILPSRGG